MSQCDISLKKNTVNKQSLNIGDLVDQAILNLMRPLLTIKTHKAKLKMMKHEGQNILKKVIQKTKK